MLRRLLLVMAGLTLTACIPAVPAAPPSCGDVWSCANLGDQDAAHWVVYLITDPAGMPRACVDKIVSRESHWTAGAANPRSGARGLWQIMLPLHEWRFEAHGWDATNLSAYGDAGRDWADAAKNTTVAVDMWAEQGFAPWGGC